MGKIFDAIVLVLYPVIVLAGLTYLSVRWTALLLIVLLGRHFIWAVLKSRETSVPVIVQAVAMAALLGVAAASGSEIFLRFTPFLISLVFFFQFAVTLRAGSTPIIERFAKLQRPDLPDDHVRYCRSLTRVWLIVFTGNSLLVLLAAFVESKTVWAFMVGPGSYLYLGLFLSAEYTYRKRRFQEFNEKSPLDRLLRPLLQKRSST